MGTARLFWFWWGLGLMSIVAILFDFDYTLADSSRGAIDCMAYALCELGL
jgi:phosphoglycolate phosphatase-like HAD superfamily hydrolase